MNSGEKVEKFSDLRQGDVLDIPALPTIVDGEPALTATPLGVVIISQTCDIVQESASKANLTVAPLVDPTAANISNAKRGRSATLLYLDGEQDGGEAVADLQFVSSLPKVEIIGRTLIARHATEPSVSGQRQLAHRIGRAYTRFAFPDEVVPFLKRLRDMARKKANTMSAFGRVIDFVSDLRVSSDQWQSPDRQLRIYVVVSAQMLMNPEDADPDWDWSQLVAIGARRGEDLRNASLARISELLARECERHGTSPAVVNMTSLLNLWDLWKAALEKELLIPHLNDEVSSVEVVLTSDEEFTLRQWRRTESLDLEVLSDTSES